MYSPRFSNDEGYGDKSDEPMMQRRQSQSKEKSKKGACLGKYRHQDH